MKTLNRKGFTLIEIIIVMIILGILILLATPRFLRYVQFAQYTRIINDVRVAEDVSIPYKLLEKEWPVKSSIPVEMDGENGLIEFIEKELAYMKIGKIHFTGQIIDKNSLGNTHDLGKKEDFHEEKWYLIDDEFIRSKTSTRLRGQFLINDLGEVIYIDSEEALKIDSRREIKLLSELIHLDDTGTIVDSEIIPIDLAEPLDGEVGDRILIDLEDYREDFGLDRALEKPGYDRETRDIQEHTIKSDVNEIKFSFIKKPTGDRRNYVVKYSYEDKGKNHDIVDRSIGQDIKDSIIEIRAREDFVLFKRKNSDDLEKIIQLKDGDNEINFSYDRIKDGLEENRITGYTNYSLDYNFINPSDRENYYIDVSDSLKAKYSRIIENRAIKDTVVYRSMPISLEGKDANGIDYHKSSIMSITPGPIELDLKNSNRNFKANYTKERNSKGIVLITNNYLYEAADGIYLPIGIDNSYSEMFIGITIGHRIPENIRYLKTPKGEFEITSKSLSGQGKMIEITSDGGPYQIKIYYDKVK